jgi:hypothetical protein
LGAHGDLSTLLAARDLVASLEAIHAGEVVVGRRSAVPSIRSESSIPVGWSSTRIHRCHYEEISVPVFRVTKCQGAAAPAPSS